MIITATIIRIYKYQYITRLSSSFTIIKNMVYNIDDNLKLISHPNKLNKAQT